MRVWKIVKSPAPVREPLIVNFDFEADPLDQAPLEGETIKHGKQALLVSSETAYFNGELDTVLDIPATFNGALDVSGRDFSIGSRWHPFVGMIDEVRLYKRVLSAVEIRADFDKEKGKRTSNGYKLVE